MTATLATLIATGAVMAAVLAWSARNLARPAPPPARYEWELPAPGGTA